MEDSEGPSKPKVRFSVSPQFEGVKVDATENGAPVVWVVPPQKPEATPGKENAELLEIVAHSTAVPERVDSPNVESELAKLEREANRVKPWKATYEGVYEDFRTDKMAEVKAKLAMLVISLFVSLIVALTPG